MRMCQMYSDDVTIYTPNVFFLEAASINRAGNERPQAQYMIAWVDPDETETVRHLWLRQ